MPLPTRPPHDGHLNNKKSFEKVFNQLSMSGPVELQTPSGTPFTAEAKITKKGNHPGQQCIRITRDGQHRASIYSCCWEHETNCSRTHISMYSPVL